MTETRPVPVYAHEAAKVRARRPGPSGPAVFVERAVFVFGAVFAAWFAVTLVRSSLRLSWWHLLYLVAFWAVASYLALPRLHRVLTEVYVPDYFIGRVRTAEGLLGDPVNLAFNGSAAQIDTAMRAAGWVVADPITLASARRIAVSSVTGRSYPEAPVSSLFLFGRQQDVAFQQEVENSPAKRHHVRFWKCPDGWFLPGGHRVDWLAAGTYDRAVGLSLFTLQVTHKIDADTDAERDYIVDTLCHADPAVSVRVIENFSTGYHHRNGGGDLIATDGDLPVVDVGSVAEAGEAGVAGASSVVAAAGGVTGSSTAPPTPARSDWTTAVGGIATGGADGTAAGNSAVPPRPSVFLVAIASIIVGSLLSALQAAQILPSAPSPDQLIFSGLNERLAAAGLFALFTAIFQAPLLVFMLRGHAWARYLMLLGLVSNGTSDMLTSTAALDAAGPSGLLIIATRIVAVLALSDRSAAQWVQAIGVSHRRRKAARRAARAA